MHTYKRNKLVLRVAIAAAAAALVALPAWAGGEFDEAELFFELNNTDEDLGIHASIDGGPWVKLIIEDPKEHEILRIRPKRRLRKQGLTQLFWESAEPTFEEFEPEKFFKRFPEGEYEIEGISHDGSELENKVELSHVMPAPPGNVTVSGLPAAEDCDSLLPEVSDPVIIDWDPVVTSHPEVGESGPIEIVRYQFFVERDDVKLSVDLPPEVTQFQVPSEILALGDEFKFEIITRESSGNNTAIESCFVEI